MEATISFQKQHEATLRIFRSEHKWRERWLADRGRGNYDAQSREPYTCRLSVRSRDAYRGEPEAHQGLKLGNGASYSTVYSEFLQTHVQYRLMRYSELLRPTALKVKPWLGTIATHLAQGQGPDHALRRECWVPSVANGICKCLSERVMTKVRIPRECIFIVFGGILSPNRSGGSRGLELAELGGCASFSRRLLNPKRNVGSGDG